MYDGQWREGAFHGKGTYTKGDGSATEGLWRDGLRSPPTLTLTPTPTLTPTLTPTRILIRSAHASGPTLTLTPNPNPNPDQVCSSPCGSGELQVRYAEAVV